MDQITTYATLQAAVAGMIHRDDDADLTANVPLFVQLCEADLNDKLLLRDMESDESLTLTADANYVALPTGFISPIAFWLVVDGVRIQLGFVMPQDLPYNTESTQPQWVAVDGPNLRFDCPASEAYAAFLRCIKKSNLSDSNTSNYLLLKRPDVYLYGTLKQAALWTQDDNAAKKWDVFYQASIAGLKAADNRARSIVPLRTDIPLRCRSNIFTG